MDGPDARPASGDQPPSAEPLPLRYLSSAELDACLPRVAERIALARQALVALADGDAEMPPKIGVHPRQGALLHAMPAWLRSADLVGLKWVSAFPGNKARGLPAIGGLVVLNDPDSGLPTWIMDAARITAVRTAAVSGVAIELFAAPPRTAVPAAERVALLGAGVQARSHLEVIAALLPRAQVALFDRNAARSRALADEVNDGAGREVVVPAPTAADAVAGAGVVVTVATLGAAAARLAPADVGSGTLIVAVDFATYVSPELARAADVFAVDDRDQFLHYRGLGYFDGYPDPGATLGQLCRSAAQPVTGSGRTALVTHLGVGLADVIFANAIARAAAERGLGTVLER